MRKTVSVMGEKLFTENFYEIKKKVKMNDYFYTYIFNIKPNFILAKVESLFLGSKPTNILRK